MPAPNIPVPNTGSGGSSCLVTIGSGQNVESGLNYEYVVPLMAVFAAIGWAVATMIMYLPGISSQTRATAASIRDHAFLVAVLTGLGTGIGELVKTVLNYAIQIASGGSGGAISHAFLHEFFRNSALLSGILVAFVAGLIAAASALPVVGMAVSIAAGVLFTPAMAIISTIFVMSVAGFGTSFFLENVIYFGIPIGLALVSVPGKFAKGLGVFLMSLAMVAYVGLPVAPYAIAAVLGGFSREGGGFSIEGVWNALRRLCEVAKPEEGVVKAAFNLLTNPLNFYSDLSQWFLAVVVASIVIVLLFAAARALSHSMGGVSASL